MASGPAHVHPERHVYGPRPLGALVPAIARPAFRRRSPATAQVMADWPAIVGPRLAAIATPRRLSAGRLTLACAGPVAMELQHLAPELIARINTHLGAAVVASLGFVQATQDAPPPAKAPRTPDPDTIRRADAAVADLPEGELRAALAALGRAVLNARLTAAPDDGKGSTLPPRKQ
jgi:hypothetical protein